MRKFSVTEDRKKIRKGLDDLNSIKSYLCTEKKERSVISNVHTQSLFQANFLEKPCDI